MNRIHEVDKFAEYIAEKYNGTAEGNPLGGYDVEIPTKYDGCISIYVSERGACIRKPNGTTKYYYEVSNAKLKNYIRQTCEYWL